MWALVPRAGRLRHSLREHTLVTILNHVPRLMRHPVWREVDPEQGLGRGVLLIPGFGFGDRSLTLTGAWLRARGYRPAGSRTGMNLGCTMTLVLAIEHRLEEIAAATGRKVIVLGQSRGGWLGRIAAARRPDLVRGLVMLGSPVLNPLGVHPKAVRSARFIARLAAAGVPGVLSDDCLSGRCFRTARAALARPLPRAVPAISVYSRLDTVAPWRLCLDPSARCVEVSSTHTSMSLDPEFYLAVSPNLAAWAGEDEVEAHSRAC